MTEQQNQNMVAELVQQAIENKEIDIPMLPEVANKALVLSQDPEASAAEMAKLIQSDQALAAHVMRIANSVAYTPLANLVSLQQAIARLGMMTISEIALAASIGAKLFDVPGYEQHIAAVWRHALASGLWAKEIARQIRSNVEVAFLAGLLHSIGRPAVLQLITDLAKQQGKSLSDDAILQLESTFQHETSLMVVKLWQMPALVVSAISDYKNYQDSGPTETQSALVNAGVAFADHFSSEDALETEQLMTLPVLASLNLYQDEIETLLNQSEAIEAKIGELVG